MESHVASSAGLPDRSANYPIDLDKLDFLVYCVISLSALNLPAKTMSEVCPVIGHEGAEGE